LNGNNVIYCNNDVALIYTYLYGAFPPILH